jgi:hypothetical protein
MRPYLTILRDCFHEAMSNRVLWVLLVVSTVCLLMLAPVKVTERRGAKLQFMRPDSAKRMLALLQAEADSDKPTPATRVWARIDQSVRSNLVDADKNGEEPWMASMHPDMLRSALNKIIDDPTFYDAEVFRDVPLNGEAKELADRGADSLDANDSALLNRYLLAAAFPGAIDPPQGRELLLGWMFWQMDDGVFADRETALSETLNTIIDYVLGVGGVFLAIIATAPIIPRTYDPGPIDLLLSKPVSRTMVFLTKYLGGCIFIFLIAGYVVVGLWLIFGVRLGYWNHRMLMCIPVLTFLFAIYYTISAITGVVWRNSIVSIMMAIVFWMACYTTWLAKTVVFESGILTNRIIENVADVESGLLVVANRGNDAKLWSDDRQWSEAFAATAEMKADWRQRIGPPVYDAKNKRVLALANTIGFFGEPVAVQGLYFGSQSDGYARHEGPTPPDSSELFLRGDGQVIVLGFAGIHRLKADLNDWPPKTPPNSNPVPPKVDEKAPPGAVASPYYESIGPSDWQEFSFSAAAIETGGTRIIVCGGKMLRTLSLGDDGRYAWGKSVKMPDDGVALATSKDRIAAGLADGRLLIYDAHTLESIAEYQPREARVVDVDVSPDGRWFAAKTADQHVWAYDAKENQQVDVSSLSQGDVVSIDFAIDGQLLYGHAFNSVDRFDLASGKTVARITPDLSMPERLYWYLVRPLYTVFPKPGELGDMIDYLVKGKTVADDHAGSRTLNIWPPIWSNLAFVAVVLSLGSLYVARKDF